MTPILADAIALAAVVGLFSLAAGLALGVHAWRGGKLWREGGGEHIGHPPKIPRTPKLPL